MKQRIVTKKQTRFQRTIENSRYSLNLFITCVSTSIILLLIAVPYSKSIEYQTDGFFKFIMYTLFAIQILPLIGIIISIIQLFKSKTLKFKKKELIKISVSLFLNLLWASLFATLIISVMMSINS